MSTALNDVKNLALLGAGVYPVVVSDTNTGVSIDLLEADGRCFAVQAVGVVTGTTPSLAGKLQESADNAAWTDVANAAFTPVTAGSNLQTIVFDRTKRYLRHSRTLAGTSPSFALAVLIGEQKKTV